MLMACRFCKFWLSDEPESCPACGILLPATPKSKLEARQNGLRHATAALHSQHEAPRNMDDYALLAFGVIAASGSLIALATKALPYLSVPANLLSLFQSPGFMVAASTLITAAVARAGWWLADGKARRRRTAIELEGRNLRAEAASVDKSLRDYEKDATVGRAPNRRSLARDRRLLNAQLERFERLTARLERLKTNLQEDPVREDWSRATNALDDMRRLLRAHERRCLAALAENEFLVWQNQFLPLLHPPTRASDDAYQQMLTTLDRICRGGVLVLSQWQQRFPGGCFPDQWFTGLMDVQSKVDWVFSGESVVIARRLEVLLARMPLGSVASCETYAAVYSVLQWLEAARPIRKHILSCQIRSALGAVPSQPQSGLGERGLGSIPSAADGLTSYQERMAQLELDLHLLKARLEIGGLTW